MDSQIRKAKLQLKVSTEGLENNQMLPHELFIKNPKN